MKLMTTVTPAIVSFSFTFSFLTCNFENFILQLWLLKHLHANNMYSQAPFAICYFQAVACSVSCMPV